MSRADDRKRAISLWDSWSPANRANGPRVTEDVTDLIAAIRAETFEAAATSCECLHPDSDRWDAARVVRRLAKESAK